jgi:predicted Mrr-cat superfamily restriction endonuclease
MIQLPIIAGELQRFSKDIAVGDQVITYNPSNKKYTIGVFDSAYRLDHT